ncbi:hypothetical protein Tco_1390466 [Tanacetum coccineum]
MPTHDVSTPHNQDPKAHPQLYQQPGMPVADPQVQPPPTPLLNQDPRPLNRDPRPLNPLSQYPNPNSHPQCPLQALMYPDTSSIWEGSEMMRVMVSRKRIYTSYEMKRETKKLPPLFGLTCLRKRSAEHARPYVRYCGSMKLRSGQKPQTPLCLREPPLAQTQCL